MATGGAVPLTRTGPTGSGMSAARMEMYLGALGEMPMVAGAQASLPFMDGSPARSRQAADAVWSAPEASSEHFVFAGSRWRGWTVRTAAMVAVTVAAVWIAAMVLGVRTTPATLPPPPPPPGAHQVNR